MKNTLNTLIGVLFFVASYQSQTVYKYVDEMTDEVDYIVQGNLVCLSEDNKEGFSIMPVIEGKIGFLKLTSFIIQTANFSNCSEGGTLIILMESGEKITLNSWNDWNCDVIYYFDLTQKQVDIISGQKIDKIRLTDNDNYHSLTVAIEDDKKEYFQNLKIQLSSSNIETIKE